MKKKGVNANLIHGNPSGGGGIDDKAKNANLEHGTVASCKDLDPNHVTGPARGSRPRNQTRNGKPTKSMF